MSAPACDNCQTPLPSSVVASATSQVVRCVTCGSLLLWSGGRVVRSTKAPGAAGGAPRIPVDASRGSLAAALGGGRRPIPPSDSADTRAAVPRVTSAPRRGDASPQPPAPPASALLGGQSVAAPPRSAPPAAPAAPADVDDGWGGNDEEETRADGGAIAAGAPPPPTRTESVADDSHQDSTDASRDSQWDTSEPDSGAPGAEPASGPSQSAAAPVPVARYDSTGAPSAAHSPNDAGDPSSEDTFEDRAADGERSPDDEVAAGVLAGASSSDGADGATAVVRPITGSSPLVSVKRKVPVVPIALVGLALVGGAVAIGLMSRDQGGIAVAVDAAAGTLVMNNASDAAASARPPTRSEKDDDAVLGRLPNGTAAGATAALAKTESTGAPPKKVADEPKLTAAQRAARVAAARRTAEAERRARDAAASEARKAELAARAALQAQAQRTARAEKISQAAQRAQTARQRRLAKAASAAAAKRAAREAKVARLKQAALARHTKAASPPAQPANPAVKAAPSSKAARAAALRAQKAERARHAAAAQRAARAAREEKLSAGRAAREEKLSAGRAAREEKLAAVRAAREEKLAAVRAARQEKLVAARAARDEKLAASRAAHDEKLAAARAAGEAARAAKAAPPSHVVVEYDTPQGPKPAPPGKHRRGAVASVAVPPSAPAAGVAAPSAEPAEESDADAAPTRSPAEVAAIEARAVAKARVTYRTANISLFRGDFGAAEQNYKQALLDFPGYVAGYRGLGLLYARSAKPAQALEAWTTYCQMAPDAKDVRVIQRRMTRLRKLVTAQPTPTAAAKTP